MAMPIVIEYRDGRSCPRVQCDQCGGLIETADEANYEFGRAPEGESVPVRFVHRRPECSRVADPLGTGDMPLDVLLVYLADNLRVDMDEAREHAEDLDAL
jgi:hypothetical protein